MKGFLAFTKKEILEQFRTYKWLIFIAAFFIFGMMSPLLAKLTPEIISSMNMNGIKITIPEANAVDAYGQFFKNLTQMGILILLLVFGGTVSNELMKGTLVNILAKGLPRHTVLLSKYTAAILLWSVGFLISAVTCYGYTVYLFQDAAVDNLVFSFVCLWIFGLFVIALIFLSSAITTGSFGGLTLSALTLIILLIISMFPKVEKFNPVTLASKNTALLNGTQESTGLYVTIWITIALIAWCLTISILIFNKKRI